MEKNTKEIRPLPSQASALQLKREDKGYEGMTSSEQEVQRPEKESYVFGSVTY